MNLTPHFTLEEFCRSDQADRLGIDNTLPEDLMNDAISTCYMLEGIRAYLNERSIRPVGILVSSGYRCPALNTAIGSKPTGDHPKASAVDFKAPAFGTPRDIALALAPVVDKLGIGQLIYEFGTPQGGGWVHVSKNTPEKIVNRIITINRNGTFPGIVD